MTQPSKMPQSRAHQRETLDKKSIFSAYCGNKTITYSDRTISNNVPQPLGQLAKKTE